MLEKLYDAAGSLHGNGTNPAATDSMPEIDAGIEDLPTAAALAWQALTTSNHPERLFRRGGTCVPAGAG